PLGDVDTQELLDGRRVAEVVDERRHVVEPVGERDRVVPAALLAVLLEGPVQVPDLHVGVDDDLAVQLGRDPDDPVHRGMGGADADVDVLGTAAGAAPLTEHELAPRRLRHRAVSRSPARSAAGGGWSYMNG